VVNIPSGRFRFGSFELDARAGELRKGDRRIRLQEQPFQILLMLLERPGDVVTREEICRRLWPDGTVVEFDHSIGTAVKKLRQALGDEAESPPVCGDLASPRLLFSRDQKAIDHFLASLSFGGGAINQVNVHLFVESMPFGGVGYSGIGHYYGKDGFDALNREIDPDLAARHSHRAPFPALHARKGTGA
jgi:hypothetical protein